MHKFKLEYLRERIARTYYLLLLCLLPASLHAGEISVSVAKENGAVVANAVVYVEPLSYKPETGNTLHVNVEQINKTFTPFVSVVPVGTRVHFPNRDGIGHHVYSFSPAKIFRLPLSDKEKTGSVLLDQPGVVTVGCNIHDWMVAYLYVVETPYYTVTDSQGEAVLTNLRSGDYRLHVWHPGIKASTEMTRELTLGNTDSTQQQFTIELKPDYFWRPGSPEQEALY